MKADNDSDELIPADLLAEVEAMAATEQRPAHEWCGKPSNAICWNTVRWLLRLPSRFRVRAHPAGSRGANSRKPPASHPARRHDDSGNDRLWPRVTAFVLDASVTMRWFFAAGKRPRADAILHALMSTTETAALPILWRYEVSSVLARAQLRDGLPAQEAANFIADLDALRLFVDHESALRILTDVHRLAVAHRLTSYDAACLELALRRNLPLATLDADLIATCDSAGVQVR